MVLSLCEGEGAHTKLLKERLDPDILEDIRVVNNKDVFTRSVVRTRTRMLYVPLPFLFLLCTRTGLFYVFSPFFVSSPASLHVVHQGV